MSIVSVQAKVTKTAAFDGASLDISSVLYTTSQDWTLVLEVLTNVGISRFQFSDSVDAFTTTVAGPTAVVVGAILPSFSKRFTFTRKDFPDLRFGVASAVLRLSLTRISEYVAGDVESVQYKAWLEI